MSENKYGYKVCYTEKGKIKLKIYLITNTYELAKYEVRWYENHPQQDRKDRHFLDNPLWYILPIRTKREHKKLWKGCPF